MKPILVTLAFFASSVVAQAGTVETLQGFARVDTKLNFTVTSGGCTSKSDFSLETKYVANGQNSGVHEITLVRNNPDYCEALPHQVNIEFNVSDIQLVEDYATVKLMNPVVIEPFTVAR